MVVLNQNVMANATLMMILWWHCQQDGTTKAAGATNTSTSMAMEGQSRAWWWMNVTPQWVVMQIMITSLLVTTTLLMPQEQYGRPWEGSWKYTGLMHDWFSPYLHCYKQEMLISCFLGYCLNIQNIDTSCNNKAARYSATLVL
ncbi:hypothetical protein SLA2020_511060 [Shorea laevis]